MYIPSTPLKSRAPPAPLPHFVARLPMPGALNGSSSVSVQRVLLDVLVTSSGRFGLASDSADARASDRMEDRGRGRMSVDVVSMLMEGKAGWAA